MIAFVCGNTCDTTLGGRTALAVRSPVTGGGLLSTYEAFVGQPQPEIVTKNGI